MSVDLQELLQTPPAQFLKMLENMNHELTSQYDSIVPALRRRIDDHSESQCEEIRIFLEDTELQLKMVSMLRRASRRMMELFSKYQMHELDIRLYLMTDYEEELKKAVKWLNDALEICYKPE